MSIILRAESADDLRVAKGNLLKGIRLNASSLKKGAMFRVIDLPGAGADKRIRDVETGSVNDGRTIYVATEVTESGKVCAVPVFRIEGPEGHLYTMYEVKPESDSMSNMFESMVKAIKTEYGEQNGPQGQISDSDDGTGRNAPH